MTESTKRKETNDVNNGLNKLSARCHEANKKWWLDLSKPCDCPPFSASCPKCKGAGYPPKERNVGELLMLCVSELAEAMEGHRKDLPDDKLPHRTMFEVELADCLIRIFDIAGGYNLDLAGAFEEKMDYNTKRKDHTIAARLEAGGKKY